MIRSAPLLFLAAMLLILNAGAVPSGWIGESN